MHINVQYISDTDGVLTVAFYANEKLCSIVAGECTFMDRMLVQLRECIQRYDEGMKT